MTSLDLYCGRPSRIPDMRIVERPHVIHLNSTNGTHWTRHVRCAPEMVRFHMLRIGHAQIRADHTPRPAFREIVDTLRWENMR